MGRGTEMTICFVIEEFNYYFKIEVLDEKKRWTWKNIGENLQRCFVSRSLVCF